MMRVMSFLGRDRPAEREEITAIIRRLIPRGRPRIQVTGPQVTIPSCQICLGNIKEGSDFTVCECGKEFHTVCLARTGFCPYCDRSYEHLNQGTGSVICPLCGDEVPSWASMCNCGAIFIEEGSTFQCPNCRTRILYSDSECPRCGEAFDLYETVSCPACDRTLPSEWEVCTCGALLADRCPECGAPLEPDDLRCGRCGTEFEFL
ncbi:MAG: double zinc ribbon domain-containing protein [Methanomassiliicoccales archaeon]